MTLQARIDEALAAAESTLRGQPVDGVTLALLAQAVSERVGVPVIVVPYKTDSGVKALGYPLPIVGGGR